MKFEDVVNIIEEIAPAELAEKWDNSGVQIGYGEQNVTKLLVCLDITEDVINEAIESGCEMILSHHPLIFGSVNAIDEKLFGAKGITSHYIRLLIQNNISVYSAHTNFDNAPKGNNFYLAQLLALKEISDPTDERHIGIIGSMKEKKLLKDFVSDLEDVLKLPKGYVICTGEANRLISKVAICTGAGGDFLDDPIINDCDVLVTGDVKLNRAIESRAMGIVIANAGHYGTEKIFSGNIINLLKKANLDIDIMETTVNTNPYML